MNGTESNVRQLRRRNAPPTAPPTFVVTGGPGTGLPEGQYLIRALDRAVVLSHRNSPSDTWSRPVEAERS